MNEGEKMNKQTQKMHLKAEAIYKYLMNLNDKLDTLVTCKEDNITLIATDQGIYEALGSIENKEDINVARLIKFLEVVDIYSYKEKFGDKKILTDERVKEIRDPEVQNDK